MVKVVVRPSQKSTFFSIIVFRFQNIVYLRRLWMLTTLRFSGLAFWTNSIWLSKQDLKPKWKFSHTIRYNDVYYVDYNSKWGSCCFNWLYFWKQMNQIGQMFSFKYRQFRISVAIDSSVYPKWRFYIEYRWPI